MNKLTLRYKILFSLMIPILIFFSMIGFYLYYEYTIYYKMKNITKMISSFESIGNLYTNLQNEKELMIIVYSTGDNEFFDTLVTTEQQTNRLILEFQEKIGNNEVIGGEEASVKIAFQRLVDLLEKINEKRNEFSVEGYDSRKIISYYDSLEGEITTQMGGLLHRYAEFGITASLVGYMDLLQWQYQAGKVRWRLYKALKLEHFADNELEEMLMAIGEEDAFQLSFLQVASDEEKKIYDETVKLIPTLDIEEMQKTVTKQADKGKFKIKPEKWWSAKTQQMKLLHELSNTFLGEIKKQSERIRQEKLNVILLISTAVIFCSSLAIFMMRWNMRLVSSRMQEEATNVSSSANTIYSSVSGAFLSVNETAAAVTETATTIAELRQTGRISAEKIKNVIDTSKQALLVLETSEDGLNATIERMNKVKEGMVTISDSIVRLGEHTNVIRGIIGTVDQIAEQAHILAVNAAIEAAKAGEQGRGFSVVAQEVKSLADQSKKATMQVRHILNDIQNATNTAVMATELGSKAVQTSMEQSMESNTSIQHISKNIGEVVQSALNIGIVSQQQLVSVEQITHAMDEIRKAANLQTKNMAEIKDSTQKLAVVVERLTELVKSYKL